MGNVKKSDMGIAGALIVLSQFLTQFKSTQDVSGEIKKLRTDIEQVRADQEKFFVKKEELKKVISKLDGMDLEIKKIRKDIRKYYVSTEYDSSIRKTSYGIKF